MKKVMILGLCSQNCVIAGMLDKQDDVSEIICADHNYKRVKTVCSSLKKGRAVDIDTSDYTQILHAAGGVDYIVSNLPAGADSAAKKAASEINAAFVR